MSILVWISLRLYVTISAMNLKSQANAKAGMVTNCLSKVSASTAYKPGPIQLPCMILEMTGATAETFTDMHLLSSARQEADEPT